MCWSGKITDLKEAYNDITVYKVLMKKNENTCNAGAMYVSPFLHTPYSLNVEYKTGFKRQSFNFVDCSITEGLHCYSENVSILKHSHFLTLVKSGKRVIGCYEENGRRHPVIIKCIIPKGHAYYLNKEGEIVSSCLILKEEIKTHISGELELKNII